MAFIPDDQKTMLIVVPIEGRDMVLNFMRENGIMIPVIYPNAR